jgi:hypothetical protein
LSVYSGAIGAIRSIILIEERMNALSRRVDEMADEMRHLSTRLTRLETIVEIVRPDGSVLRVAADKPRSARAASSEGVKAL